METRYYVLAAILAAAGLGLLWVWNRMRAKVALMAATPTTLAADVARQPPGTLVEVKGVVRCSAPLTGEFSGRQGVFCRSVIERKTTRWRDGKREEDWTTESSNETRVPFEVEDASGRVRVDGQGADMAGPEVLNESANTPTQDLASLAGSLAGMGSYDRRRIERLLSVDSPVYVLGWVQPGGTIGAAPPGAARTTFLITHESEEEYSRSSNLMMYVLLGIAALLFAGAGWVLYSGWAA